MLKLIVDFFSILSKNHKKKYLLFQFLIIFQILFELLLVVSIIPFMALLSNKSILLEDNIISFLYKTLGFNNYDEYLFYLGALNLLILIISSSFNVIFQWFLFSFSNSISKTFSNNLFKYYVNQDYLFYVKKNSSIYLKKIQSDLDRVSNNIVTPILILNSRIFFCIFIFIFVIYFNPIIAVYSSFFLIFLYFLIFYLIKKILFDNGKIISRLLAVRYKIFNQVFSGIKEIIFLKRQEFFFNKNKILQEVMFKKIILNNILTVAPKNIIEIISYISIVIIFFLITNIYNQDYSKIIPALAVIGFVAIKMIPAIQQIFSNLAYIGGSSNSFYQIFYDLKKHYKNIKFASNNKLSIEKDSKDFHFKKTICLDNISFKYPNREFEAIKKINIKINKNNRIGIIGPSGSGKSTIINIIMGLIYPTSGNLVIDNLLINKKKIAHLQNFIGYVPQNFFLFDGTIVENVTLESNVKNINFKKFNTAIKLSKLKDFLKELPGGIHSKIGEGGVLLSGGQRQRLAIARSLYMDKEILIFDEATSSLDVFAEDFIKKTLKKFMNNKTIIIVSHRIELIKECDVIYCINNGSVVDQGSFKYLKNKKYMKNFLNLN